MTQGRDGEARAPLRSDHAVGVRGAIGRQVPRGFVIHHADLFKPCATQAPGPHRGVHAEQVVMRCVLSDRAAAADRGERNDPLAPRLSADPWRLEVLEDAGDACPAPRGLVHIFTGDGPIDGLEPQADGVHAAGGEHPRNSPQVLREVLLGRQMPDGVVWAERKAEPLPGWEGSMQPADVRDDRANTTAAIPRAETPVRVFHRRGLKVHTHSANAASREQAEEAARAAARLQPPQAARTR